MTTATIIDCPKPGDVLQTGQRVIASGVHCDPTEGEPGPVVYGVLALTGRPNAHYLIAEVVLNEDCTAIKAVTPLYTEANIVPAVHCFHETFGFWGGGALTGLGNESPHG